MLPAWGQFWNGLGVSDPVQLQAAVGVGSSAALPSVAGRLGNKGGFLNAVHHLVRLDQHAAPWCNMVVYGAPGCA